MSLKLPDDKVVYNLPEQVGVNTKNIKYLAEKYKEIDSIPAQYAELKADYEDNIKTYFDDTMKPTFTTWTNTFNGWTNTLDTYLASMSSAALGAIANGTVSGDFAVSGSFTANSIIENMSGYSYVNNHPADFNPIYVGAVKNGNKLTLVWFFSLTATQDSYLGVSIGDINIPSAVLSKIRAYSISPFDNAVDTRVVPCYSAYNVKKDANFVLRKYSGSLLPFVYISGLTPGTTYLFRYEVTFLLSNNLAA